nr:proline-rich protein 36-like [Chrysemys picta bellii]
MPPSPRHCQLYREWSSGRFPRKTPGVSKPQQVTSCRGKRERGKAPRDATTGSSRIPRPACRDIRERRNIHPAPQPQRGHPAVVLPPVDSPADQQLQPPGACPAVLLPPGKPLADGQLQGARHTMRLSRTDRRRTPLPSCCSSRQGTASLDPSRLGNPPAPSCCSGCRPPMHATSVELPDAPQQMRPRPAAYQLPQSLRESPTRHSMLQLPNDPYAVHQPLQSPGDPPNHSTTAPAARDPPHAPVAPANKRPPHRPAASAPINHSPSRPLSHLGNSALAH